MRRILSDSQTQDLVELHTVAHSVGAQVVIIGAVALSCFLDDLGRFTSDVDLVIALDLRDFQQFVTTLDSIHWRQEAKREHRWRSRRGSLIDLLPAGPELRSAKLIRWPVSDFTMSLVGFDHVFARAVSVEFAPGVHFEVAPLPVIAILKIVAHLDDPYRRAKDLDDLKVLMKKYEANSDRIFSDEVFAAELEDIDQASAFLLGLDVGRIMAPDELSVVRKFAARYRDDDSGELDDWAQAQFQLHLRGFERGIGA